MKINSILGIVFAVIFFLVGFLTLSDYGLNIDEPAHFMRGQALFHYLLTGQKTYEKLNVLRRSEYQYDGQNGTYYIDEKKVAHPAVNGILAAAFNYVFYQKLGWIGDVEAYHLFEVFVSSLLVLLIFFIASKHYGKFAGLIASFSLSLYPLFLGESRFNIKDPIETTFYAFTIYLGYLAVNTRKLIYFILSAIFFSFAIGTKFNAFFIPFIFIPYLIIRFFSIIKTYKLKVFKKISLKIYLYLGISLIISPLIYLYFNPELWTNPIGKFFGDQISYYKDIGTGNTYQPGYELFGFNLYPLIFISISTPLIILSLSIIGLYFAFKRSLKEKEKFSFLVILWFMVPILRVVWPGTTIYSGVRQIMEYVPAMAILAGIGASDIVKSLKLKILNFKMLFFNFIFELLIILSFLPITFKLISLHPNENLYINPLVGGLQGAIGKKIPGAAESMGNAYLQGIWWLNDHAEKNAHYKLAVGTGANIPSQFVRKDLRMGNYFSGMGRKGEYMMEMKSVDFPPPIYFYQYLDTFLNPVYEDKVDGVTILKVWKNDKDHTKNGYLNEKEEEGLRIYGNKEDGFIDIQLKKSAFLTSLEIEYDDKNCVQERSGVITYSLDRENINFTPDSLFDAQGLYASTLQKDNLFVYFFAAYPAKYIKLIPDNPKACLLQYKKINIKSLRDISP